MFDDDFFKKTSDALNGFFDSIEKSIKGLQKEVDSTKDKVMKQAEESAKNAENAAGKADSAEPKADAGAAKTDAKTDSAAGNGASDGKGTSNPIGDWFSKILDGGQKVPDKGIAYYRADTGDTVNIFCEVPGCDRKDVGLKYEKDTLIVRAKKSLPEVSGTVLFKETAGVRAGEFEQKIRVGKVERDSISASYKNGVLTITCKRPQV